MLLDSNVYITTVKGNHNPEENLGWLHESQKDDIEHSSWDIDVEIYNHFQDNSTSVYTSYLPHYKC